MEGVAANLGAMLDDRFQRLPRARHRTAREAPIDEALALIVRERLTGQKPPRRANAIVDLWRPFIEDKAGAALDR